MKKLSSFSLLVLCVLWPHNSEARKPAGAFADNCAFECYSWQKCMGQISGRESRPSELGNTGQIVLNKCNKGSCDCPKYLADKATTTTTPSTTTTTNNKAALPTSRKNFRSENGLLSRDSLLSGSKHRSAIFRNNGIDKEQQSLPTRVLPDGELSAKPKELTIEKSRLPTNRSRFFSANRTRSFALSPSRAVNSQEKSVVPADVSEAPLLPESSLAESPQNEKQVPIITGTSVSSSVSISYEGSLEQAAAQSGEEQGTAKIRLRRLLTDYRPRHYSS